MSKRIQDSLLVNQLWNYQGNKFKPVNSEESNRSLTVSYCVGFDAYPEV